MIHYSAIFRFPGFFENSLFRILSFYFPWDFEIAGFNCPAINILTWLRGFRVKCNFLKFLLSIFSQKDLDTKKITLNIEVCPESLGAVLEF